MFSNIKVEKKDDLCDSLGFESLEEMVEYKKLFNKVLFSAHKGATDFNILAMSFNQLEFVEEALNGLQDIVRTKGGKAGNFLILLMLLMLAENFNNEFVSFLEKGGTKSVQWRAAKALDDNTAMKVLEDLLKEDIKGMSEEEQIALIKKKLSEVLS